MPRVDVYATTGLAAGKIILPEAIFAAKVRPTLMAQATRVYLSNQRHAQPQARTRGDVSGSGKKIWAQKGTGRARHGDQYAPIFVGGGVAHGPVGNENHKLKMSVQMRHQALYSALTSKLKAGELVVVNGLAKIEPKTGPLVKILGKLKIKASAKTTIILPKVLPNLSRAAGNIAGLRLLPVDSLNTYEVLNGGQLIFMKEAVERLKSL